jgi:transcription termination factor NusB
MSQPPRLSLMRKRASRLAAVQAMYSEAMIETSPLPAFLANQLLQSWADSHANHTNDMPHGLQPEAALLNKLIATAQQHRTIIEDATERLVQPGWKKERMSMPLRALLQVFASETLAVPTRAAATLIEEYTEVGAQLLTDEELAYAHKAFNLLLDHFRPEA